MDDEENRSDELAETDPSPLGDTTEHAGEQDTEQGQTYHDPEGDGEDGPELERRPGGRGREPKRQPRRGRGRRDRAQARVREARQPRATAVTRPLAERATAVTRPLAERATAVTRPLAERAIAVTRPLAEAEGLISRARGELGRRRVDRPPDRLHEPARRAKTLLLMLRGAPGRLGRVNHAAARVGMPAWTHVLPRRGRPAPAQIRSRPRPRRTRCRCRRTPPHRRSE
jgi:hypothetical protein